MRRPPVGNRLAIGLSTGCCVLLAFALRGGEKPRPAASILLEEPVVVSRDRAEVPHIEPSLAAHPKAANLLFGAAITYPNADPMGRAGDTVVDGFRSTDGGRSWIRVPLPACRIDPWVRFGTDGALFVSCLGGNDGPLNVYRSPDGGITWAEPARVAANKTADRPVLSAEGDQVIVAFGQYASVPGLQGRPYAPAVSWSGDGGRTFNEPAFVLHDHLVQQPFDAVTLSSGTHVLFFMDYATAQEMPLLHRRTWAVRSENQGRSFSLPALVLEQSVAEMPWSVAVDRSTLHPDRLYVAVDGIWQRRPGVSAAAHPADTPALFLLISDDGGESWRTGPARIDVPEGANAETPAIAVNRDGVVGVSWYDTRSDPRGECFDLYFSASVDGASTFLPGVRVTSVPSCPRASERQRGVATRWSFGGDYSGLAAGADGRFHLFWADSRSENYQIWSAAARISEGTPSPIRSASSGFR